MLTSLIKRLLRGARRGAAGAAPDERLTRGIGLQASGKLPEAETAFRALLAEIPDHPDGLHLLGHVLALQGRASEAVDVLRRLTAIAPQSAEVWFSLGSALRALGRYAEAAEAFRTAGALDPGLGAALVSCGDALAVLERLDEAEDCYRQALARQPELAEAHYNFGNLLHREGRIDEAVVAYRRAVELKPDFVAAHSNLVYALNFSPAYAPGQVFAEHVQWARRHAAPLGAERRPHRNPRVAERRLRVGYVSPNFRDHAVAYFFEPALRHHDRLLFSVYLYSDVRQPDARTARLRGYGDAWRDIAGLPDEAVAELVRDDEIDILVDLTGHTDGHRLLLFARKPAPVQVTWNGYANTTGMEAMDYRIVDRYTDPPGMTERWHTERLVRLPEIYMAFEPPEETPPVGPPPLLANGYATFGSFNALAKVTPQVIATWSQILRAAPDSRLLMLTVPGGRTRERLVQAFAENAIAAARLEFLGKLAFGEFLAAHARADIALDPFPFNGTTTTCQTLWMGVPVVTLAGASHVSRVGLTLLANLGLACWVAGSTEEYVTLAARLAGDADGLRTLRAGLRRRMQRSPTTDGARLARHLEDAYRKMWEDYCRPAPPA